MDAQYTNMSWDAVTGNKFEVDAENNLKDAQQTRIIQRPKQIPNGAIFISPDI